MSYTSTHSFTNSSKDAVSVICEMVRQHLGINERVRCIVAGDEENEVYVKDTVETLKYLDLQHPAAVHVVQACQGHKALYGCGGKSMLFLIGQLTSHVHSLMQQGIPLSYLEELMYEALDHCMEHLQGVAVPVTVSSTLDADSDQSQGPYTHVTSPVPVSSNSSGKIDSAESPYVCAQGVGYKPGLSHSSVKETASKVMTAGGSGLGGVNDGHRMRSQSCKSSGSDSSHKPSTVRSSENIVGSVTLSGLSSILQGHTKSSSSASMRKNVMLRSRHMQPGDSSVGQEDCSLSDPSVSLFSVRKKQDHVDHCPKTEDVSVEPGLYGYSACTQGDHEYQSVSHEEPVALPQSTLNGLKHGLVLPAKKASICVPEEAQSLSHGCHEMMSWAEEAMRRHLLHGKGLRLDEGLLHALCVDGGSGRSQLLDGLVIDASLDMMELLTQVTGHSSLLLINGDLIAKFRHRGYKATLSSTRLTDTVESMHHYQSQNTWQCQVLALLKQLAIGVVLVRGTVDCDLCGACTAAGIALVDRVSFPALKVLQSACRVDLVTYVLDAHEGNICQGVSLKSLREDWCDTICPGRKHLVITPPVFVQTLVISEASAAGRGLKEEEFWHCAARLSQAAGDGRVLRGGAATEDWCARLLLSAHHTQPDTVSMRGRWVGEMALYRPVVRAALAEAFLSFKLTVQLNRQEAGCDADSVQRVQAAHHAQTSLLKPTSSHPCQRWSSCQQGSRDAPDHQSCHSVMSGACKKSTAASLGIDCCESLKGKEACDSIALSDHRACKARMSTPSQPVLQGTGADPDLRDTNCALNSRQCSGLGDISFCAPSQNGSTTEEGLSKANSLHPLLPNASAMEHDFAEEAVWDNYNSKVRGWHSAVQCVCTVMRMDEVITTGIDQYTLPPHSVLL